MARRKTTELKVAQGTARKDRMKQQRTSLLSSVPTASFKLNKRAAAIFRKTCQALIDEEVLTSLDVDAATQYAFWFDMFIALQEKNYAMINEYSNGTNAIAGAATALMKCDDKVQKYSNLLGLSIKARDLMASFEKIEADTESPIEMALKNLG